MAETTFSISASANDGVVALTAAVYPPTGTAVATTGNTTIDVRRSLAGGNYSIEVGVLAFDTSSLPDDAVVSAATLRLWINNINDANGRNFVGEWYDWGGSIDATDYTATPASTAFSTDITALVDDADNDFALTNPAANVSLSGMTVLRLHVDGAQPAGLNRVGFGAFDHTVQTEPRLIVTYTTPAPASVDRHMPRGLTRALTRG